MPSLWFRDVQLSVGRHILFSTESGAFVLPHFGGVQLSSITASDLQGHFFKYRHPKYMLMLGRNCGKSLKVGLEGFSPLQMILVAI